MISIHSTLSAQSLTDSSLRQYKFHFYLWLLAGLVSFSQSLQCTPTIKRIQHQHIATTYILIKVMLL